jgi:hypothetical protein
LIVGAVAIGQKEAVGAGLGRNARSYGSSQMAKLGEQSAPSSVAPSMR